MLSNQTKKIFEIIKKKDLNGDEVVNHGFPTDLWQVRKNMNGIQRAHRRKSRGGTQPVETRADTVQSRHH